MCLPSDALSQCLLSYLGFSYLGRGVAPLSCHPDLGRGVAPQYHTPAPSQLLRGLSGKEFACQCGSLKQRRFDPWVRKIPWRRKWQPTPVLLPGESHGQRSLAGYSPWGCKEQDTTEQSCVDITWWIISFCFPLFVLPPDYYVCFSSSIFPIVLSPNIFIPFHLHVSFLSSEVRET